MKAEFSEYLTQTAPAVKAMIARLQEHFDYVSVLSTDSTGFRISISQKARDISSETMMTERGNVIRVYRDGLYSEYAFNEPDLAHPEAQAEAIRQALEKQIELLRLTGTEVYETGKLADEPQELFVEMETGTIPEDADLDSLVKELTAVSDAAMKQGEHLIDCRLTAQSTHVCKMFLTPNRDLRQSYVYSEGTVMPMAMKDGRMEYSYAGVAERQGPEIFAGLRDKMQEAVRIAEELLTAERIEPGEYDVITTPEVSGLIAHEAFGHGVEMDMFVKNRALGKEYIGKRVGSNLVTMHEGALAAVNVASYAFDDEGTLAGDVIEIDHGILKTGVCDALSALRLGVQPTGNGKRENFEHKAYTRMTNTIFEPGNDSLDDMIASVDYGYLLAGMQSGM
ncbi:MAG: TldD/PmbA family protein, partial [Solobacterium sp.]|nr:TldD/PmbA family protein [Solobacterium sp.]